MKPRTYSPYTPLWGNPELPRLRTVPDPQIWARYRVKTLRDIMPGGRFLPFSELKSTFSLPPWMFFQFMQLQHATRAQFPELVTLSPHSVEQLLTACNIDRTLSSIYFRLTCAGSNGVDRAFTAWQRDIPSLTEEDWSESLQQYIPLMIAAKDR